MIAGFRGTVISLERAVCVASLMALSRPLCAGLGGVTLPATVDGVLSSWLVFIGEHYFYCW